MKRDFLPRYFCLILAIIGGIFCLSASAVLAETADAPFVGETEYRLAEEPRIRAGIWKPTDFVQFKSETEDYVVLAGTVIQGTLPKNHLGVLKYEDGQYVFHGGDLDITTPDYIRLTPADDPHAVFRILNLERKIKWQGARNFNAYRGALEFRQTQDKKLFYLINDLPLEDYVAGIAETSNGAPLEYIKALLTAARTYAYYLQQYSAKHQTRNFDVVAHTGDQLYLGYESEGILPRVAEAVKATRGYFITYQANVVITPYFGHTKGRTKAWTEVWGGRPRPWLVSVKATYDRGNKRLFGHGVGMSQRDAAIRAKKDGSDWQKLIKYYYTGVEVERMYE